jgi:hypothetical protein
MTMVSFLALRWSLPNYLPGLNLEL